jgi:hypothetical protein
VTWSCGLVRSSADALEPRRMRPELRPARSPFLMVFKSIRGSQVTSAATCALASENDSPTKTIPRISRTSLLGETGRDRP